MTASASQFLRCINRVLGNEGGYVNDPEDPGGETKWGICKRSYPNIDIKNLTRDQAIAIYYRDFWMKIHGNEISDGCAYQLLDAAVNSGCPQAIRFMQRALGVADDGHFGPVSMEAMRHASEMQVVLLVIAERMEFMTVLKNWPSAGKGWTRRMATNVRYALEDLK